MRLFLGTCYYKTLGYSKWLFGGNHYGKQQFDINLPYEYASHQTPLLRNLKDVDMELQVNKITNLKIAVSHIHTVVLHPGETFSYWKLVGNPTARKGYLPGMVLHYGTFHAETGGGLCQLSNLIYWLTLHTPLTVVERYRHSFDVFPDSNRTQPFGSGATCFYNYRDLVIKNETDQAFQLYLWLDDCYLHGCWKSEKEPLYFYEIYEKEHHFKQEYWGGYSRHNVLYRRKFNRFHEWIENEYVTENHALMMYTPFLESKTLQENLS